MAQFSIIKPYSLEAGDMVGIISPASPPSDPETIAKAADKISQLGFKTRIGINAHKRLGYLAGNDSERASDIMTMFLDPSIKAIMCLRGGYGCSRILDLLDYEAIRSNPKPIIGFSDITSLQNAILSKSGLVSFHGPNLDSGFIQNNHSSICIQNALKIMSHACSAGELIPSNAKQNLKVIAPGQASGLLIGGNLTVFTSVIGTPYQPPLENSILFLEDVQEKPYRIDRMLTFLAHAKVLDKISGVLLGEFTQCDIPDTRKKAQGEFDLAGVFKDRLGNLDIPVLSGLPLGHSHQSITLPLGAKCRFDTTSLELLLEELPIKKC